ncbi:PTS glucose transporter subunit IIA [[Acholeplasma] multilocale]|uniref:PTS glucose transporter subunit IIA n=1 Tax=[Acholeplasma] multilocale TaxID=264638 RepID=UPI00047BC62C|nr:PTS glucose transporter subunit IIABC [[Acholeplasma] multilocale]
MENKAIKVYSPVDGEVGSVVNLGDGVFSEKMLGDGFYVRADEKLKKADFYAPIEKGTVSLITDTKHAFFFQVSEDISILMHIGLDTVSLDGKPFEQLVNVGDTVTKDTKVVKVDTTVINKAGLDRVCPITINSEVGEFEFKLLAKTGTVKQGDLIGEFVPVVKNEVKTEEVKSAEEFFLQKNKYQATAHEINKFVGGPANYTEVYNCMTRLRFAVKNKDGVNVTEINSLPLTKGVVWNGNELQVIIGQDVYKVKEAVDQDNLAPAGEINFEQGAIKKASAGKRFLQMFGGIMVQIIPMMVGAGIIQAIIGILTWLEVMPAFATNAGTVEQIMNLKGGEIWWFMLFVIGKSSGMFMGITIAWSAAKYFKLRGTIAIPLAVMICSPLMFLGGGAQGLGGSWTIFSMGTVEQVLPNHPDFQVNRFIQGILDVKITGGNIKIFVVIFAMFTAKKLDDWIGTWVPSMFELIIRPFMVFFITATLALGIYMPIWNFFEAVISLLMYYIGEAPIGIGTGVYTALWQVCVVFGMHLALGMVSVVQQGASAAAGQGGFGIFGLGGSISVYAQLGAVIAVIMMTKNAALRREAIGYVPVALLGVTEPMIYGINLPKKRPLIAGVIAAFIAGCFAGALGVTQRISTGIGIFEVIGYFQNTIYDTTGQIAKDTGQLSQLANGLLYIASCAIVFGGGIGFGILLNQDRKTEKQEINTLSKSIFNLIVTTNEVNGVELTKEDKAAIKAELSKSKEIFTKEELAEVKQVEKVIVKELKLKTKLAALNESEAKKKEKLMKAGKAAVVKENLEKADKLMAKFNAIDNTVKREALEEQISEVSKSIDWKVIEKFNKKAHKHVNGVYANVEKQFGKNIFSTKDLQDNIENALNVMPISYKLVEVKPEFDIVSEVLNKKEALKQLHLAEKANNKAARA